MKLNKDMEQAVLKAASQVSDSIAAGEEPTEALVRVCKEAKFRPNTVRLLGRMVNTGQQEAQRNGSKLAVDKFAAFALVDPEAAVQRIWASEPVPAKAALSLDAVGDYLGPPTWLADPNMAKHASVLEGLTKTAHDTRPAVPAFEPLYQEFKQAEADLSVVTIDYDAARQILLNRIAKTAEHFRKLPEYLTEKFEDVDYHASHLFGKEGQLAMNCVAQMLGPGLAKRASSKPPLGCCDPKAPVYQLVGKIVEAAANCANKARLVAKTQVKARHLQEKLAARRPYRGNTIPVPGCKSASLVGGMVGGQLASQLAPPKEKLVGDMLEDFESPAHEEELRQIRTSAMLHDMMANDEVISQESPNRVLQAYNELAGSAPRVAGKPGLTRALLRRQLQSNVQPFEMKELVDMEKGIQETTQPKIQGRLPEAE